MSKTIIVAVHDDGDLSRDALALGVTLARAEQAAIVLAAIWVSPLGAGDGVYAGAVRDEMERELQGLLAAVPAGIEASADLRGATSVVRGLHHVVEDHHGGILVLGAARPHRAGMRRGDVALAAMHDAPCAVAVAPSGYCDRAAGGDVVVAWDETPEADVALDAAALLAADLGTGLRIVHVLESPYQWTDTPWRDADGVLHWFETLRGPAREALERARAKAAARAGGDLAITTDLREGDAAQELEAATADAAIVVTGSRAYGTVHRLVVGSLTAGLLRHAEIPVLVLPRGIGVTAA